jgi:signal peptidase
VQLSKNVGRGLTYVLVVVAIVVGAQLFVGSALGASPVYVVVSRSMVPTLEVGDLVITQSVPFSSIQVGQVIIYVQPDPAGGAGADLPSESGQAPPQAQSQSLDTSPP